VHPQLLRLLHTEPK